MSSKGRPFFVLILTTLVFMSINNELPPSVPKHYPLGAVWRNGTYATENRLAHLNCEHEPVHLLQCEGEDELVEFMQRVGEVVKMRAEEHSDERGGVVVSEEMEAVVYYMDPVTGEPTNCYLCSPLDGNQVGWTGHPDNTIVRGGEQRGSHT